MAKVNEKEATAGVVEVDEKKADNESKLDHDKIYLTFKFSITQTNKILAILAKQPYNEVFEHINAFQKQGNPQLPESER